MNLQRIADPMVNYIVILDFNLLSHDLHKITNLNLVE